MRFQSRFPRPTLGLLNFSPDEKRQARGEGGAVDKSCGRRERRGWFGAQGKFAGRELA
jgi:hypothetical protein